MTTFIDFLAESAVPRRELDVFLDAKQPSWAQFDPELGYILGSDTPRDGLDGCLTISTTLPNGARRSIIYADRPCRINTYGNSFTQCHQVSDHETWQEYLAAHLGEPLRNFGVGGYGVYQAYRRMLREEASDHGAEYLILYIWGDDHQRSLLRCRHALTHRWWDGKGGRLFHGNFWAHLEIDLEDGSFREVENPLSTPEQLYRMSDPAFMVEALRDDLALHLIAYSHGLVEDAPVTGMNRLAELLDCPAVDWGDPDRARAQAGVLRDRLGFRASQWIIRRTVTFASDNQKKVLLILFDPAAARQLITTGTRYDQEMVDFLEEQQLRYFDMNRVHHEDYQNFAIPVEAYFKRYLIGHYSPAGNHFFAFALKDTLVDWLDPKPPTYRADDRQNLIDFCGYL